MKYSLSKHYIALLHVWLEQRGKLDEINPPNQIIIYEKPTKCSFCSAGNIYKDSLCEFCYKCIPTCALNVKEVLELSTTDMIWIQRIRLIARNIHASNLLRK